MARNKLIAEMVLEYRKMQQGLRRVGRMVNGFSSKSGMSGGKSLAANIGKGLAVGAAAISVALAAAIAAAAALAGVAAGRVIASAVRSAAENERFQMRFEILTGSRGAGNDVLKQIRDDALRTGVAVSDMADNVGKFMAFGFSGDEAMELNQGILDVGGAVGLTTRDMKLLGVALAQVKAKGVASMEELRQQIAEKGIPIFDALQDKLGVTGAELSKMIQEGRVSADEVMDIFKGAGQGEGPFAKFAGGAERMANTFEGRINVIKRNYEEFLRVFGQPIKDALLPVLNAIQNMMVKLRENAAPLGEAVANMFTGVIAAAQTIFSLPWSTIGTVMKAGLIFGFKQAGNFGRKMIMGMVFFSIQHFKNMARLLGEIAKIFSQESTWKGLGLVLNGIALTFVRVISENISSIISALKEASPTLGKLLGNADSALEAAAETARAGADEAFGGAEAATQDARDQLGAAIEKNISDAIDAFKRGFEGEDDFFNTGEERGVLGSFLEEIRKNYEELKRQREEATKNANQSGGAATGGEKTATGGGGFSVNSRLAQAMNVIGGQNQFEIVANSQRETTEAVKENTTVAKEVAKNTKKPSERPQPATVLPASTGQDYSSFA